MNEQVFTITTSACAVSLVISTPSFSSVPTITSASTRFLAQPSEIMPTRTGRAIESCFIKDRTPYVTKTLGATLGVSEMGQPIVLFGAVCVQAPQPLSIVVKNWAAGVWFANRVVRARSAGPLSWAGNVVVGAFAWGGAEL